MTTVCVCDDYSDGGRKPHIHWDEYENDKSGIEFVDENSDFVDPYPDDEDPPAAYSEGES